MVLSLETEFLAGETVLTHDLKDEETLIMFRIWKGYYSTGLVSIVTITSILLLSQILLERDVWVGCV